MTFAVAVIVGWRAVVRTSCFFDCPRSHDDLVAGGRLWFAAFALLAVTPAVVGVLRARRRWLAVAGGLHAVGVFLLVPSGDALPGDGICTEEICGDEPGQYGPFDE